jgi:tryptophan-rich sensory protein
MRLVLFLFLNFAALGLGQLFTGPGVNSEWSRSLTVAPWTPPGWVFGVAWNSIMIAFAVWLNIAWKRLEAPRKEFLLLYGLQWILNVSWNPLFFYLQEPLWALPVLLTLTGVVIFMAIKYRNLMGIQTLWLLPYCIWLPIACSLNWYIVVNL